ncbi:MAG: hypothetical protein WAJ97_09090 [Terriglobales bacterium]|jgi:hypothetical protein
MNSKLNKGVIVARGNTLLEPLDGLSHPPTFSVHYRGIVRCAIISAPERLLCPSECLPSIPAEDFSFIEQEPKIILSGRATMFRRSPKPFQSFTR